jgi:hypothetical protein
LHIWWHGRNIIAFFYVFTVSFQIGGGKFAGSKGTPLPVFTVLGVVFVQRETFVVVENVQTLILGEERQIWHAWRITEVQGGCAADGVPNLSHFFIILIRQN